MTPRDQELYQIHSDFLERWSLENIESMTLEQYVDVKNKDTFSYWVETRALRLGNIKNYVSGKFGIYKRDDPMEVPKKRISDDVYSWMPRYGSNRIEAFRNVKKEILDIINYSIVGDFNKIDGLHLQNMYRWKIAFMFSGDRLIPIYNERVLKRIAKAYGIENYQKAKISIIQQLMSPLGRVKSPTFEVAALASNC